MLKKLFLELILLAFSHFLLFSKGSCPSGYVDRGQYVSGEEEDCQECPSNCATCVIKNDEVICSECPSTFYLSEDFECLSCYSDCEICVGETISECLLPVSGKGYDAFERFLADCPEGCEYCPDSLSIECYSECKEGYYVSFAYDDYSIICMPCPDNCMDCYYSNEIDLVVCSECYSPFALDLNDKQQSCTEDCGSLCFGCYSRMNICDECISGYELVGDSCKKADDLNSSDEEDDPDENNCNTENCKSCVNNKYECDECLLGYSFPYDYVSALENSVRRLSRWLENDFDFDYYFYYWYYNYYGGGVYSPLNNWQDAGYDYSTCASCEEFGSGCIECDFKKGVCLKCELGGVWNSAEEECADCDLEGCLVCETYGICLECVPGYYWDGVKEKCIECHDSCGYCVGPGESECTVCPITRWAYWHPYQVTGSEGADGFLNRAPGPWSTGFTKYGLMCSTECETSSEQDHDVLFFSELRTCWVEIEENELIEQKTLGPYAVSQRDAADLAYLAAKYFQVFEYVGSKSAKIELSNETLYMLKKDWEGKSKPESVCVFFFRLAL